MVVCLDVAAAAGAAPEAAGRSSGRGWRSGATAPACCTSRDRIRSGARRRRLARSPTGCCASGEIVVRDALITWNDDLRNAPQLVLDRVQFRLEHAVRRATGFGLRGTPPPELAAPIDLRGECRGGRSGTGSERHGQALRAARLRRRRGLARVAAAADPRSVAARARCGSGSTSRAARRATSSATSSSRMWQARLERSLPELELARLAGRCGWRMNAGRREIYGRQTCVREPRRRAPHSIRHCGSPIAWRRAAAPAPRPSPSSSTAASSSRCARSAPSLPLPEPLRADLARFAPRGMLSRGRLQWDGAARRADGLFADEVDFADIGVAPQGVLPGGSGLSGSIDVHDGRRHARLASPRCGARPAARVRSRRSRSIACDAAARRWRATRRRHRGAHRTARLRQRACRWQGVRAPTAPRQAAPAAIDLAARVVDADATAVHRYLPRWIGADTASGCAWALAARARARGDAQALSATSPTSRSPTARAGRSRSISQGAGRHARLCGRAGRAHRHRRRRALRRQGPVDRRPQRRAISVPRSGARAPRSRISTPSSRSSPSTAKPRPGRGLPALRRGEPGRRLDRRCHRPRRGVPGDGRLALRLGPAAGQDRGSDKVAGEFTFADAASCACGRAAAVRSQRQARRSPRRDLASDRHRGTRCWAGRRRSRSVAPMASCA